MNGVPSTRRRTAPSPRSASRDEEALRLRVVEARRVELVELHVRDLGARPVRHRHPVARRDVGVRRVEVDLPRPAGGEHGRAREDRLDLRPSPPRRARRRRRRSRARRTCASVMRSIAMWSSRMRMRGCAATRPRSARSTSRPVMSAAWRRGARCGRPRGAGRGRRLRPSCASRVEARAASLEHRDPRRALAARRSRPTRSWQSPAPATSVSRDVGLERVAGAEDGGDAPLGVLACSTRRAFAS